MTNVDLDALEAQLRAMIAPARQRTPVEALAERLAGCLSNTPIDLEAVGAVLALLASRDPEPYRYLHAAVCHASNLLEDEHDRKATA